MKYFVIEETAGQGTRIYIKENGKYIESMPIEVYTNPESFKCKYGDVAYKRRMEQLKGLERVENERAYAWENGWVDML